MYAKFQSYSAQCSVKLHHYIVCGSILLSVHMRTVIVPRGMMYKCMWKLL
jgi:hypothetical protein